MSVVINFEYPPNHSQISKLYSEIRNLKRELRDRIDGVRANNFNPINEDSFNNTYYTAIKLQNAKRELKHLIETNRKMFRVVKDNDKNNARDISKSILPTSDQFNFIPSLK